MKKSEITKGWRKVLIPAKVKLLPPGDDWQARDLGNDPELGDCDFLIEVEGALTTHGSNFACGAYRHFIPVDKWPKRKIKP